MADSFSAADTVWAVQEDYLGYQFKIHGQYLCAPVLPNTWKREIGLSKYDLSRYWFVDPDQGVFYLNVLSSTRYNLHITNSEVSLSNTESQKISFYSATTREVSEYDTE